MNREQTLGAFYNECKNNATKALLSGNLVDAVKLAYTCALVDEERIRRKKIRFEQVFAAINIVKQSTPEYLKEMDDY